MIVLALLTLILSSCSIDMAGGGTGTETVNCTVLDERGNPVENMPVTVVDQQLWIAYSRDKSIDPTVFTGKTDSRGEVAIPIPKVDGKRIFSIVAKDSLYGSIVRTKHFASIPNNPLNLSPLATLEIKDLKISDTIFADGVTQPITSETKAMLPQGSYTLFKKREGEVTLINSGVNLSSSDVNSIVIPNTTSLPLTDFSNGFRMPVLENFLGDVAWFIFSDAGSLGLNENDEWFPIDAQTEPIGSSDAGAEIVDETLKFATKLDSSIDASYGGVGVVFPKTSTTHLNLSSMEALNLKLSGEGRVQIVFKHLHTTTNTRYIYSYDLTPNPKEITIPMEEFRVVGDKSWSVGRSDIALLQFQFLIGDNREIDICRLNLSSISFEGVGVELLMR